MKSIPYKNQFAFCIDICAHRFFFQNVNRQMINFKYLIHCIADIFSNFVTRIILNKYLHKAKALISQNYFPLLRYLFFSRTNTPKEITRTAWAAFLWNAKKKDNEEDSFRLSLVLLEKSVISSAGFLRSQLPAMTSPPPPLEARILTMSRCSHPSCRAARVLGLPALIFHCVTKWAMMSLARISQLTGRE